MGIKGTNRYHYSLDDEYNMIVYNKKKTKNIHEVKNNADRNSERFSKRLVRAGSERGYSRSGNNRNGYRRTVRKNVRDVERPLSEERGSNGARYDENGNYDILQEKERYSIRENNKDVEKLLKENAQLQDANELLRQELQLTKGHRLNQSNIKSIAKSFIKKYGAYELDEQTLY